MARPGKARGRTISFGEEAAILEKLRDRIPSFECIPGCTDCCGPVPFSRKEWANVDRKVHVDDDCQTCPYADQKENGGCRIHNDRPILCRMFGAVDDPGLTCPHGRGPEVKLTKQEGDSIRMIYRAIMGVQRHTYGPFASLFRKVRRSMPNGNWI